jgi:hypothetical protein
VFEVLKILCILKYLTSERFLFTVAMLVPILIIVYIRKQLVVVLTVDLNECINSLLHVTLFDYLFLERTLSSLLPVSRLHIFHWLVELEK